MAMRSTARQTSVLAREGSSNAQAAIVHCLPVVLERMRIANYTGK